MQLQIDAATAGQGTLLKTTLRSEHHPLPLLAGDNIINDEFQKTWARRAEARSISDAHIGPRPNFLMDVSSPMVYLPLSCILIMKFSVDRCRPILCNFG